MCHTQSLSILLKVKLKDKQRYLSLPFSILAAIQSSPFHLERWWGVWATPSSILAWTVEQATLVSCRMTISHTAKVKDIFRQRIKVTDFMHVAPFHGVPLNFLTIFLTFIPYKFGILTRIKGEGKMECYMEHLWFLINITAVL